MKSLKLLILGILVVTISVPAMAAAPAFTGDVEADFTGAGILTIPDPGGVGDVGIPSDPTVPQPPAGTISGWDMIDFRLAYDQGTDTLYVGLNSYGIAGDADGDGNPSVTSPWLSVRGGTDLADFDGTECFAVYFDLDQDGTYDVIAGVSGSTDITGFSVNVFTGAPGNPAFNFGAPLGSNTGTATVGPDAEFTIIDFSTLPGQDADLGAFEAVAFMGSLQDNGVGEDSIPYEQTPCVDVDKTVEPEVSKVGDEVLYTIEVCNCDEESDLTRVSVVDTVLGDLSGSYGDLAADECETHSFFYTIQPDDPDPLENVVTAVYEDILGFDISDTCEASVELIEVCIEIDKTVEPTVSKVGDEVLYTICIHNCGQDIALENVVVTDPLLGGVLGVFPGVLAIDQTVCVDFPYVIQPDDPDPLDNCATVESDPEGPLTNPVADTNCASVDLVVPCINITKDVDNPNPCYGDTVTYTICIDNCGDYPLENIEVTDPHLGAGPLAGFPSTMDPEDPQVCVDFPYVVQETDPCPLINTARVDADPLGPMTNPVNDEDPAEICPEPCGDTFCGFTQGFYGNQGGKKCGGIKTADLIDELIDDGADPVVVGVVGMPGHSITLGSSDCIIDLLPAGGTPAVLPEGNFSCPVDGSAIPDSILKEFSKKESRFNNVLIGQVVALTLNVRLGDLPCLSNDVTDSPLGGFEIPEGPFCVVPYDDPEACPEQYESPIGGMTVAELLNLANAALAGEDTGYSLSQINDAVTAINEAFDECRTVVSCPNEEICGNGCDDDFDGLVDEGCDG